MMGNDKMRDEFESWANSLFYPLETHENGLYVKLVVQDMWAAWQASRAAVVVELPGNVHHTASGMRLGCQEAIEAAGLQVKR